MPKSKFTLEQLERQYESETDQAEKNRLRSRMFSKRHPDRMLEHSRTWRIKNPKKFIFTQKKSAAKRLGIPFELVFSEIEWPDVCPVLGIKLDYGPKNGRGTYQDNSPSFDRLRNDCGYTRGNVRIISMRANRIKSDATLADLEAVCLYVRRETAS